MILGDAQQTPAVAAPGARATLDDLFRRMAQRNPHGIALVDPSNRESFTDGAPRQLTYAEADRVISALAARLHDLSLPLDSIVGIQLPNTVDGVLTLLGVLRAGMIAAPLPLLWRRGDIVAALSQIGAKALITCRRVGATDHATLAMQAAADIFPVRYVCSFGADLPDGIVALDGLYTEDDPAPPPPLDTHPGVRAAHLALITWEATSDSLVPVARNHAEIVAGGLAVMLEGRVEPAATLLSAVPPASFAGVAVSLVPWLLTGGTLVLHHPFDPETLQRQLRDDCDVAVLPAPVIPRLLDANFFAGSLRTLMGLWRAPERMNNARAWPLASTAFVDIACFGETVVIPARRGPSGKPAPLPFGIVTAPRGAPGAIPVAELTQTRNHSLAVSGLMVPRQAFPPGAESAGLPHFETANGVVDTGYPCRVNLEPRTVVVTGPPSGIAGVGGYRFALRELQQLVAAIDSRSRITALPDALCGHRLAGDAADTEALRAALTEFGVNPLVADAFA